MTSRTSAASLSERSTCKDRSVSCEIWATNGMCRESPDMEAFMSQRCPFACDMCGSSKKRDILKRGAIAELRLKAGANDDAAIDEAKRSQEERKMSCQDFSSKCEVFAMDGLCSDSETGPLMAKTCPYACDRCKREVIEEVTKKEAATAEKEGEVALETEAKKREEGSMEAARPLSLLAREEEESAKEAVKKEEEAAKKEEEAAKKEEEAAIQEKVEAAIAAAKKEAAREAAREAAKKEVEAAMAV